MKIAFIGQKGIPAISGGVERHVEELSTRLVKLGHEVYVYTRPNYSPKELKEYKGVKLVSLPSIPSKHLDAISHTFLVCLDVTLRRKVGIIHFHSIGPSSLIWFVKLLNPKIPVVATFHTQCYYHKKWGGFARLYLKFGELILCQMANRVITVSKTLRKYAKEKYNRKASYIPNGVAVGKILSPEEIRRKWGLKRGNYILTVSRLVRHKGVHHLIDAYKKLKTEKKLVIVGDGFFTDDYVKELKKMTVGNKSIVFTGEQKGRTLAELFSSAYLFVQPSESEGLSIALLEAMAYGQTVLVSDIPENKEAIGETGFTFKNKDSDDLTERLKYLLDNLDLVKGRKELSRSWVKENYSWDKVVKSVVRVYKSALEDRQSEVRLLRLKLVRKFISFL